MKINLIHMKVPQLFKIFLINKINKLIIHLMNLISKIFLIMNQFNNTNFQLILVRIK